MIFCFWQRRLTCNVDSHTLHKKSKTSWEFPKTDFPLLLENDEKCNFINLGPVSSRYMRKRRLQCNLDPHTFNEGYDYQNTFWIEFFYFLWISQMLWKSTYSRGSDLVMKVLKKSTPNLLITLYVDTCSLTGRVQILISQS